MNAVQDVYDFLLAQGIAGGATGWTLLRRRHVDGVVGDRLVVVSDDGGAPPEQGAAAGIGDGAVQDVGVHVAVRGRPWNGDESRAKAREILDALHGRRNATIGSTFYYRVKARTAEPVFLGFDESGRPEHTIGFLMLAPLGG